MRTGVSATPLGSDNGVFPHALSGHEFVYRVEAGMPEMEAIQAATVNAVDLLRISDKLGSVEVGKLADLVAVEANPLENIELIGIGKITAIMFDVEKYRSDLLPGVLTNAHNKRALEY